MRQSVISWCGAGAVLMCGINASAARGQCTGHWDSEVSAGVFDAGAGPLRSMAVLSSGDVAVAGGFHSVNGVASNGLAIYHPASNTWTAVADAPNPVAVAAGAGGTVVMVGNFTSAGGVAAAGVARFDPGSGAWTALLTGSNPAASEQSQVAVAEDGAVFVGGAFDEFQGEFVGGVVRRDPQTGVWGGLGGGPLVDSLQQLVAVGGGRAAVTSFYQFHGDTVTSVHVFDPAMDRWNRVYLALGHVGTYLRVRDVAAAADGTLVIAGSFDGVPGANARNIARFDMGAGTWSALGAGVAGEVLAVAALPSGDVAAYAATGLFRFRASSASWTFVSPPIGAAVSRMVVLPSGDFLLMGAAGNGPFLGRFVVQDIRPSCAADFNCSGTLDTGDLLDYLSAWFAGDARADVDGAAGLTPHDIFGYLEAWFAGC